MTYQMDNLIGSLSDMRSQLLQDKDMRSYLTTSRSYDVDDILLQRSVMNQLSIIISSCNYINSITVFHPDSRAIISTARWIHRTETVKERSRLLRVRGSRRGFLVFIAFSKLPPGDQGRAGNHSGEPVRP